MSEPAGQPSLQIAIEHHRGGRLREAEQLYRQILAREPRHAEAWHLLGMLAGQVGQVPAALEMIRHAISIRPADPIYHCNLAKFLVDAGQFEAAIATCRSALALQPALSGALFNLGWALQKKGDLEQAALAYQQTLAASPTMAEAHNNLGNILQSQNKFEAALACFDHALRLRPEHAPYHLNRGTTLTHMGRPDEAIASFRKALALQLDFADAHNSLGNALNARGQVEEAMASYRQALLLNPDLAQAHNNLGQAHHSKGLQDEAIASYQKALSLDPNMAQAHNNLGQALKDQGLLDQAVACYRKAVALEPANPGFRSNLLLALNYHPSSTPASLLEEARQWGRHHADPLAKYLQPHRNDRDPNRRLRIGYVSPDFRTHAVAQFMLPLLAAHDPGKVEVFCYSDVAAPDAITGRLRGHAAHWRDIAGLPDDRACELIHQDRIDILIDLAMHAAGNRLLAFARKPAPIQVTYLSYPGTTGLAAIDYRMTDPHLEPCAASPYTERTMPLPETYWCYEPAAEAPAVREPPSLRLGHITFGCLNNFCKVSPAAISLWVKILEAIPGSRIKLHASTGNHRDRITAALARAGISADHCEFVAHMPRAHYLAQYHSLDLALDPFPYAGGTTTCDALWMGVPVITLAGTTAVGRGGVSILSNVGLPELIAQDAQAYARVAIALAQDPERLANLRATLRDRMQNSPLMDAPRFARHFESALRHMWLNWCAQPT